MVVVIVPSTSGLPLSENVKPSVFCVPGATTSAVLSTD